jgi:tripeptidyl-peptidase I
MDLLHHICIGCLDNIGFRYHVPEHLQPHIDYITPGIKLTPVVRRSVKVKRGSPWYPRQPNRVSPHSEPFDNFPWGWKPPSAVKLPADLQGCGRNITPACIKALYQIPNATMATPGNSLGLYEQGDYFNEQDIDLFYAEYAPYVPQGTYPLPALIDGANYSVPAYSPWNAGEADIDIDMASVKITHLLSQ